MNTFVANSIQKYRKAHHWTQEQLSASIGVTRQTIIAMEKGHYTPSVLLALKLAEKFKTSVEKVFALETEGEQQPIRSGATTQPDKSL